MNKFTRILLTHLKAGAQKCIVFKPIKINDNANKESTSPKLCIEKINFNGIYSLLYSQPIPANRYL